MYAITGITGQIGGVIGGILLSAGKPVRAVLRDADKGNTTKQCSLSRRCILRHVARCCSTNRLQHRVKFAMPHEQLLALAILAFVGCFTPGPNNMIATVTGANHGFRAALPHVLGVPFGFGSMLIAGGAGVAALLLTYPLIAALIKWAGIAYLRGNSRGRSRMRHART